MAVEAFLRFCWNKEGDKIAACFANNIVFWISECDRGNVVLSLLRQGQRQYSFRQTGANGSAAPK
ncbi:hypothetical protein MTR_1g029260 [Medicago truncatula]|uniref:Uncharacterized protein n=1 Tax=Medicago truncatula TaxID=3880 RepID=A0A072VEM4_MEDTR|nr:hypothetical protein MTR_1g029260 [Medicago truncatula]